MAPSDLQPTVSAGISQKACEWGVLCTSNHLKVLAECSKVVTECAKGVAKWQKGTAECPLGTAEYQFGASE